MRSTRSACLLSARHRPPFLMPKEARERDASSAQGASYLLALLPVRFPVLRPGAGGRRATACLAFASGT